MAEQDHFAQHIPLAESLAQGGRSLLAGLTHPAVIEQFAVLLLCLAVGLPLGFWLADRARQRRQDPNPTGSKAYLSFLHWASGLAAPLLLISLIWLAGHFFERSGRDAVLVVKAMRLAETWLVVRLLSSLLSARGWGGLAALFIWIVAGLEILGILPLIIARLDSIGFDIQKGRLSLWALTKTLLLILLMLPVVSRLTLLVERGLSGMAHISPSNKVLVVKLTRICLFATTVLLAMDTVGLDFDMLTLFGGAVGLGVGFGLQRVVSNLVSGLVILMDNSVRPGDVVELGAVYGWVESLNARYVSVTTRDGTSHLVPNDELMTSRLVNWTHAGPGVRLKIPVGISYHDDPRLALDLMVEACLEHPRVLAEPQPVGRLLGFGDSAIQLDVRFWIPDPKNGLNNVKSDIQLAIYDRFRTAGISFPFPQREVSLKRADTARHGGNPSPPPDIPDDDAG